MASGGQSSNLGFNAQGAFATLTRLRTQINQFNTSLKALAKTSQTFNQASRNLNKLFTVTSFVGTIDAIRGVGSAFRGAIVDARDFEIQLAQIQTISKDFERAGIDRVGGVVTDLAAQFGTPIEDVASGFYNALSNQVGTAAETVSFLTDALEFGQATITSTADSVDTLSGVLNSYNLTAASTKQISDQLFTTIDRGRVTGTELANSIGRILPLASALGVRFSEVAASLAELTIQGVDSADAQTQLTNVMLKLIRPTEALQGEYERLGVASAEAGIAAFGFQGFLIKLTEQVGTTAGGVGELFNQIRGTRGVIGLVSTNASRYADTLREIEEASAGASEAASRLIKETNAQQLTREFEKVRSFLINDFGRSALSVLNTLSNALGGARLAIIGLTIAGGAFAALSLAAIISQVGNACIVLAAAAGAAQISLAALAVPALIVALPLALAAVAAVMLTIENNTNEATEAVRNFEKAAKEAADAEIKAITPAVEARKKAVRESISAIEKQLLELNKAYLRDRDNALNAQATITASFKRQLGDRQSALDSFVNKLGSIQSEAAGNIQGLNGEFADFSRGLQDSRFERQISGLNDFAKAQSLVSRSNALISESRRALATGDADSAKRLLDSAAEAANRAADIGDRRANGEAQVNTVLAARAQLNNTLVGQQRAQAQEAARLEEKQRQIAEQVAAQINKFNSLQEQLASGDVFKGGQDESLKIVGELRKLGPEIEKNLKRVDLGKLGGVRELQSLLRDIQAPIVSPTTFKQVPLSFAVDQAIQDVFAKLTASSKLTPPEISIRVKALTGKDIDKIAGPGGAATDIARLGTDTETAIENTKNLANTKANLNAARQSVEAYTASLTTSIRQTADAAARTSSLSEFFARAGQKATGADAEIKLLNERITETTQRLQQGDTTTLRDTLQLLNNIQQAGEGSSNFAGGNDIAESAKQAQAALLQLAATQNQLTAEQQTAQRAAFNEGLINSAAAAQAAANLGISAYTNLATQAGAAARDASQTQIQGAQQATQALNQQSAAQQRLNELINQSRSGGVTQGLSRGGVVKYFAGGGFVPKGTDTQPAMLTPGEFVMPAAQTRQFYAQLTAMRAGRTPRYMAEGGPVGDTSFGDININIGSREAKSVDGRQLAQQLRRELRRKTIQRF